MLLRITNNFNSFYGGIDFFLYNTAFQVHSFNRSIFPQLTRVDTEHLQQSKMAVDRKDANLKMLNEASQIQAQTKEAIWRIQKQAAEAEGLGVQTLEELRRQGQQMVSFTVRVS